MSVGILLVLGGLAAATALSCGDPEAQNFLYRADGLFDSELCAYEPIYYCNDPTATNYQSGESSSFVHVQCSTAAATLQAWQISCRPTDR